ncbi:translation initiation factor eIF-2B subunit alpha [Ascosphaera atra]|nr:translation initiation factor eIF-2B subunit alpha [Ascosphaera atra]
MEGEREMPSTKDAVLEQHDVPFDIVETYKELLRSDPELTMPIAAIESLVKLLTIHPSTTMAETLALIEKYTAELKACIPNSISLSAGTDLFQRYIIHFLNRDSYADFSLIREHLLKNGKKFVDRAKASRHRIANFGFGLIREDATIMTIGGSRVVRAMMNRVAEIGRRFKVIYVIPGSQYDVDMQMQSAEFRPEGLDTVRELRNQGVPVAVIPESAVAYSMSQVDLVVSGAEGVVLNGGIISRMGTYQMGVIAQDCGKPFYVVAESHKFVRLYPLDQFDLPFEQSVIQFKCKKRSVIKDKDLKDVDVGQKKTEEDGKEPVNVGQDKVIEVDETNKSESTQSEQQRWAVDYTPPKLVTAIITESGVLTPSAVSEELIKIWF